MSNIDSKQADLKRERDSLSAKLNQLREQLANSEQVIEAHEDALGDDTLQGKDTTRQLEALSREKLQVEGFRRAISKGEKRLADIDFEFAENRRLAAAARFNQGMAEARSELLTCVAKLYAVSADLRAIEEKINNLNRSSEGISTDHYDDFRLTRDLVLMFLTGNEPVEVKLANLERTHLSIANQARAIKVR